MTEKNDMSEQPDGQDGLLLTTERVDLVAYTLAWSRDHPNQGEEEPDGSCQLRVFLNGREIERALGLEVSADSGFTEVKLRLYPTSLRFEALPLDAWNALGKEPA